MCLNCSITGVFYEKYKAYILLFNHIVPIPGAGLQ